MASNFTNGFNRAPRRERRWLRHAVCSALIGALLTVTFNLAPYIVTAWLVLEW